VLAVLVFAHCHWLKRTLDYLAISPLISFTSQNTRGNPIKTHMRETGRLLTAARSVPNCNSRFGAEGAVHYCELRVSRVCVCSSGICSLAKKNP
jgi:hypothetical protein